MVKIEVKVEYWLVNGSIVNLPMRAIHLLLDTQKVLLRFSKRTVNLKPIKILSFDHSNLNLMEIVYQERGSEANALLAVYYSQKDGLENDSEA